MAELEFNRISFLGDGAFGCVAYVLYKSRQCALKVGIGEEVLPSFENERKMMELVAGAGGAPRVLVFCPATLSVVMAFCGATDFIDTVEKRLFRGDRPPAAALEGHRPLRTEAH